MGEVSDEERQARKALTCVVEAGDAQVCALVAEHGAVQVWQTLGRGPATSRWARRAAALDLRAVELMATATHTRFVVPGDPEWPDSLDVLTAAGTVQNLGGVPIGLWVRGAGDLAQLAARSVAIVGARAASSYGEQVATDLAIELGGQGWMTVSGGAYGIDAAAHRGAIAAVGPTIAVLAGGVDSPYPQGNSALFGHIIEQGVLVAEQPPGEHPTRVRFLARNRLIAALSRGVVVVEAALRSGARNTATWAGQCQRPLMAVPGPVHSGLSVTPHALIRDHEAVLVTDAAQVLEVVGEYGQQSLPLITGPTRPLDDLDRLTLAVYESLPARGTRSTDEIAARTGLTVPQCLGALTELELGSFVERRAGGWTVA